MAQVVILPACDWYSKAAHPPAFRLITINWESIVAASAGMGYIISAPTDTAAVPAVYNIERNAVCQPRW
jgi:hypothetical protein